MIYERRECGECAKETVFYGESEGPMICIHIETHGHNLIDSDLEERAWLKHRGFMQDWLIKLDDMQLSSVFKDVSKEFHNRVRVAKGEGI